NSQIGLPLAIANAPLDVNFWVLEHGASKRGEIRKLIEITKPHVRLITTIGEEHLEGFGSVDNVIWGNGEMFCGLNNYFNAVIPHGIYNHYSFLPRAWVITFGKKGDIFFDEFVINDGGTTLYISGEEFFVPVPSVGMVENLLASFGVLKSLGYDFKNFKGALRDFKSEKGRMEIICFRNFKVINDTYNANPPSMRNAIKSLNKFKNEKKILILGDMLELGEHSKALHREVGELLNTFKFYTVFFYGKEMIEAYKVYQGKKFYASSKSELIKLVKKSKKMLKDGLILLKGSRGMKLEEIIEVLRGIDNELSC
ncbi:MAG TPA: UDP-N-acetylmuramoyl-tripeptide--D-alanyl-D-alanine ligase, partial [Aquifex aeolicus]|nr:UDP-N-acetylmuramoyl-tripeptide--D-alanyl-D-alanine ligase [Aquifex aeolicus]